MSLEKYSPDWCLFNSRKASLRIALLQLRVVKLQSRLIDHEIELSNLRKDKSRHDCTARRPARARKEVRRE